MTRKRSLKFLFLGAPIVALAALVVVLTLGTGSGTPKATANAGVSANFSLSIGTICSTATIPKDSCKLIQGSQFNVDVAISDFLAAYGSYDIKIQANNTKLVAKSANCTAWLAKDEFKNGLASTGGGQPPADTVPDGNENPTTWNTTGTGASGQTGAISCAEGISGDTVSEPPDAAAFKPSSFKGKVGEIRWTCAQAGDSTLTILATESHVGNDTPVVSDALNITCSPPTMTSTATATATALPVPRMKKCTPDSTNFANGCKNLGRIWLTTRTPATRCATQPYQVLQNGTAINGTILSEVLDQAPQGNDPKGEPNDISAFQFEIRYDIKAVCIGIVVNPDQLVKNPSAACSVQDDGVNMPFPGAHAAEPQKGVARIGCVTVGKDDHFDPLQPLAYIAVLPTAETIQSLRPNQDNGIAVQILNSNCNLASSQGHTIPIASCEDVDLVIKFLEGDVSFTGGLFTDTVPGSACTVDVKDTQDIAFRWGAHSGSLIYSSFKDLSPAHPKGDGVIDIQDLQAVYGRFNSTCKAPQEGPVVNPKG